MGLLLVPVPSKAEQEQIVAEVERRLSVIEELKATVEANLKRASAGNVLSSELVRYMQMNEGYINVSA